VCGLGSSTRTSRSLPMHSKHLLKIFGLRAHPTFSPRFLSSDMHTTKSNSTALQAPPVSSGLSPFEIIPAEPEALCLCIFSSTSNVSDHKLAMLDASMVTTLTPSDLPPAMSSCELRHLR